MIRVVAPRAGPCAVPRRRHSLSATIAFNGRPISSPPGRSRWRCWCSAGTSWSRPDRRSVLLLTLLASLNYVGTLVAPVFGAVGDRIGHRDLLAAMRAAYAVLAGT